MRASDIRYLNDFKEYLEGEEKFFEFIRKGTPLFRKLNISPSCDKSNMSDEMQPLYSISFCGDGDLLSQWKYYGKNSGVAIEFDFSDVFCFIGNPKDGKIIKDLINNKEYCQGPFLKANPIPVGYTDTEKDRLFVGSCLYFDSVGECFKFGKPDRDIIPYCKNELFREEKESRLVFTTQGQKFSNINKPIQDYCVSDGKIKPFIPITFFQINNKNLIKSIKVGPGVNQNLIYNALINIFDDRELRFLEDNDKYKMDEGIGIHICLNGIIVEKSNIPFRG